MTNAIDDSPLMRLWDADRNGAALGSTTRSFPEAEDPDASTSFLRYVVPRGVLARQNLSTSRAST